ncbi:putative zinc-binding metallopeptidase [Microbacterium sp. C7(2022)]|uniref:zinc-binding metallopeptidase family protein n=1 Tax=Microbacterium sp. C7(2022) TaxID=2992759 RepID=UPI00237A4026|nr:putative zinc-binding metallopeptidase [Microbacterium sp. C7(2022)]MDE0547000.1 putative zinc-binding peptidase [Microbacterium sp. C7(2022)]
MTSQPHCPSCRRFVYLDTLTCPRCGADIGYDVVTRRFHLLVSGRVDLDERQLYPCSNREWSCNWLVQDDAPAGRCFSCRLTRRKPDADDTIALEKLAKTEEAKRRLILQLSDLGLPITPWDAREGGLGFDLLSSLSDGSRVVIGHSRGIITIDLAESLDDRREALRVRLGEPYRTILGHLRHEVGHYFQNVLITDEATWARCRELFGDERTSYQDALKHHYSVGAPADWHTRFISEYATMHPWEDFAETFAHYLHITGTLQTAAVLGVHLDAAVSPVRTADVKPRESYEEQSIERLLEDWEWMSEAFNRINRSMGFGDLYPFDIVGPVEEKLAFVHAIVTAAPLSFAEQYALARADEGEHG